MERPLSRTDIKSSAVRLSSMHGVSVAEVSTRRGVTLGGELMLVETDPTLGHTTSAGGFVVCMEFGVSG